MADKVFDLFTSRIATPDRPLYFHSDDASLRRMFLYLKDKLGRMPSTMPWRVG